MTFTRKSRFSSSGGTTSSSPSSAVLAISGLADEGARYSHSMSAYVVVSARSSVELILRMHHEKVFPNTRLNAVLLSHVVGARRNDGSGLRRPESQKLELAQNELRTNAIKAWHRATGGRHEAGQSMAVHETRFRYP